VPPPDKPLPTFAGTTRTVDQGNDRQSTCAICLEPLNTGDACRLLPCNHIFHRTCTDSWVADRHSCPTCRHDIRVPEDIPQEPQEQRHLRLAWRVVILVILISIYVYQDRIFDAIMGSSHPQEQHKAWVDPKQQNATAAQSYDLAHRYGGRFLRG